MIVEGDSYIIWHAMQSGDSVPWQINDKLETNWKDFIGNQYIEDYTLSQISKCSHIPTSKIETTSRDSLPQFPPSSYMGVLSTRYLYSEFQPETARNGRWLEPFSLDSLVKHACDAQVTFTSQGTLVFSTQTRPGCEVRA